LLPPGSNYFSNCMSKQVAISVVIKHKQNFCLFTKEEEQLGSINCNPIKIITQLCT